ncbi:MAG: hypothetical protein DMG16_00615 [Acidobacteria bacterium]|nr:MAG: hypothetical protein DMG16_00615 [Acidobacteriota bacterium]
MIAVMIVLKSIPLKAESVTAAMITSKKIVELRDPLLLRLRPDGLALRTLSQRERVEKFLLPEQ